VAWFRDFLGKETPAADQATLMRNALAGYNGSTGAVANVAWLGVNPDYMTTGRNYGASVMRHYAEFRNSFARASVRDFFNQ
jgi:hypothetical protein